MASQLSILTIIHGCLANQRRAQELLYGQYYRYAMDIAARYSRSENDADEMVRRIFTAVFKNFHSFDSTKGSFRSWLKQLIINDGIELGIATFKFTEKERSGQYTAAPIAALESAPEAMSYPEFIAMLRQLPVSSQVIFVLHELEHFNHSEIAGLLQISEENSKWHYSEARKFLHFAPDQPEIAALADVVILPAKAAELWQQISKQLDEEMPSDEDNLGQGYETDQQYSFAASKGWVGWSLLILMGAVCLILLRYLGIKEESVPVIQGKEKNYRDIKFLKRTDSLRQDSIHKLPSVQQKSTRKIDTTGNVHRYKI